MCESARQCWACRKILSGDVPGVSLSGGPVNNVCWSCWQQLSKSRRIILSAIFLAPSAGGLGLGQLAARLAAFLELTADVDNGGPSVIESIVAGYRHN